MKTGHCKTYNFNVLFMRATYCFYNYVMFLTKSGTRFFLSTKRHKLCHNIASCTFRSKKILHTSTHFYTLLHTSTHFYILLHTSTYFYTLLHGGFWVSWGGRGGMLDMFCFRNGATSPARNKRTAGHIVFLTNKDFGTSNNSSMVIQMN